MDNKKIQYYKHKLLKERKNALDTIELMKNNEFVNSTEEISSELSFYDNHPSDLAAEVNDMERGKALKANEISIIKKIDEALVGVDEGTYGICKGCGKKINEERLDFLPYAQYCVKCQNEITTKESIDRSVRPIEEQVLGNPFGYGYNDYDEEDEVGFDSEDSYQSVEVFNRIRNIEEFYDRDKDYVVEPIEKISNEQYRNQLPD